jgi:hypothetical protein
MLHSHHLLDQARPEAEVGAREKKRRGRAVSRWRARTPPLVILAVIAFTSICASGCGSGSEKSAARVESSHTNQRTHDAVASAGELHHVASAYIQAIDHRNAEAACGLMTDQLSRFYEHLMSLGGAKPRCPQVLRYLVGHEGRRRLVLTGWGHPRRVGRFFAVYPELHLVDAGQPSPPATIALWLTRAEGRWRVAKDGGTITVLHGQDVPAWAGFSPATSKDVATPFPAPAPRFTCDGPAQARDSPTGNVHLLLGSSKTASPWLDITQVKLVSAATHPCLTIELAAPVHGDTTVWVQNVHGATQGPLLSLSLAGHGSAWDALGLRPTAAPGRSWGERGSTVLLRVAPTIPGAWRRLSDLQVCVSSLQEFDPAITKPVNGGDAIPAHDAPCGIG